MAIYWTKQINSHFIAMTADGLIFQRGGQVVTAGDFDAFIELFNRLRSPGDRIFPGPPPPPPPAEDASPGELDEYLRQMEDMLVSNSLDDSDENLGS